MDIVAIDIETTGVDPKSHEIIEVGLVRLTQSLIETARFSCKVQPKTPSTATNEALSTNGYTPTEWAGAVSCKRALSWVSALCYGARPLGHNVQFDLRFLDQAFWEHDIAVPWVTGKPLDTMTPAADLKKHGVIASKSLDAICAYFGIGRPQPHRALDDALACVEIYRKLQ